jgi:hypothetical protein
MLYSYLVREVLRTMIKEQTPEDVKLALENLLHVVSKHKDAVIVGYAFSADPIWIVQVSNGEPGEFNRTLEMIHAISKERISQGMAVTIPVKEAS